MKNFFDLAKYAHTGIASPGMTAYEKQRALAAFGGFPLASLTGVDEIQFDSDGKPLISWYVKGNEVQDGTPSPDNIIMPQECGDKTAQLFDKSTITANAYISNSTGTVNSSYGTGRNASDYIDVGGLSYVYPSTSGATARASWGAFYDSSKTYISGFSAYNRALDVPSNAKYMRLTVVDAYLDTFMLSEGSTAKPHEPYGYKLGISCGATYPVYLPEPIRQIGGSVDVASAVGTIGTATRQIRKLTLTGTEDVYTVGGNAPFKVAAAGLKSPTLATVLWLCSHYMALPSNASWSEYSSLVSWQSGDGEALRFRDTACANATEFKAFLASEYSAGHPVEVWYVLAEPQTETFTSPTITPQKGANVLTVDTTLPPSEVGITGHIKAV